MAVMIFYIAPYAGLGRKGFIHIGNWNYSWLFSTMIYQWLPHDFTIKFKLFVLTAIIWFLGLENLLLPVPPHPASSLP